MAGSGWAGKEEHLGEARCLLVANTPHLPREAITHRHPLCTSPVPGLCCRGTLPSVGLEDTMPTAELISSSTGRMWCVPGTTREELTEGGTFSPGGLWITEGRAEDPLERSFPVAWFSSFFSQFTPQIWGYINRVLPSSWAVTHCGCFISSHLELSQLPQPETWILPSPLPHPPS